MVHVFASDYDGTLFKEKIIRETDIEAIQKFREAGHKFGLCTGRNINSIVQEINTYGIPYDFIIGINGGAVLTHEHVEIFKSSIDEQLARKMIEVVEGYDVSFYGVSDGYGVSRVISDKIEVDERMRLDSRPLTEVLHNGARGLYIHAGSEANALSLAAQINEEFNQHSIIAFPNVEMVDVGMYGVDKATGIKHIVDHYGFDGNIYTIGDSFNDLPMIKAYHGYVMDNGVEDVKKHANGIVETVGEAIHQVLTNTIAK